MSDTQVGKKCLVHYNDQHIQCVSDIVVLSAWLIVGREGKYISVDNGPSADSAPRSSTWLPRIRVDFSLLATSCCSGADAPEIRRASWVFCCSNEFVFISNPFV
jgi:hypothetical protein